MTLAVVTLVYSVGFPREEPIALVAQQRAAADSWIPDVVSTTTATTTRSKYDLTYQ